MAMTRRDFLIASSTGIVGSTLASPIRSSLGSRIDPFSGEQGYSAKSYVQDGLIEHWDGIENAGYGTHYLSFTGWKGLVGGDILEVKGPSLSITDNSVVIVKGGGATYLQSQNSQYIKVLLTRKFTIEIVFASPHYTSGESVGASPISIQAGSARQFVYDIRSGAYDTKGGCLQYRQSGWSSEANRIKTISIDFSKTHTYTFSDNDDNNCRFGLDGTMTTFSRSGSNLQTTSNVRLGLNQYDATVGTSKENFVFYGIRIYNRALNTGEISYNYAIDKIRFNLPD